MRSAACPSSSPSTESLITSHTGGARVSFLSTSPVQLNHSKPGEKPVRADCLTPDSPLFSLVPTPLAAHRVSGELSTNHSTKPPHPPGPSQSMNLLAETSPSSRSQRHFPRSVNSNTPSRGYVGRMSETREGEPEMQLHFHEGDPLLPGSDYMSHTISTTKPSELRESTRAVRYYTNVPTSANGVRPVHHKNFGVPEGYSQPKPSSVAPAPGVNARQSSHQLSSDRTNVTHHPSSSAQNSNIRTMPKTGGVQQKKSSGSAVETVRKVGPGESNLGDSALPQRSHSAVTNGISRPLASVFSKAPTPANPAEPETHAMAEKAEPLLRQQLHHIRPTTSLPDALNDLNLRMDTNVGSHRSNDSGHHPPGSGKHNSFNSLICGSSSNGPTSSRLMANQNIFPRQNSDDAEENPNLGGSDTTAQLSVAEGTVTTGYPPTPPPTTARHTTTPAQPHLSSSVSSASWRNNNTANNTLPGFSHTNASTPAAPSSIKNHNIIETPVHNSLASTDPSRSDRSGRVEKAVLRGSGAKEAETTNSETTQVRVLPPASHHHSSENLSRAHSSVGPPPSGGPVSTSPRAVFGMPVVGQQSSGIAVGGSFYPVGHKERPPSGKAFPIASASSRYDDLLVTSQMLSEATLNGIPSPLDVPRGYSSGGPAIDNFPSGGPPSVPFGSFSSHNYAVPNVKMADAPPQPSGTATHFTARGAPPPVGLGGGGFATGMNTASRSPQQGSRDGSRSVVHLESDTVNSQSLDCAFTVHQALFAQHSIPATEDGMSSIQNYPCSQSVSTHNNNPIGSSLMHPAALTPSSLNEPATSPSVEHKPLPVLLSAEEARPSSSGGRGGARQDRIADSSVVELQPHHQDSSTSPLSCHGAGRSARSVHLIVPLVSEEERPPCRVNASLSPLSSAKALNSMPSRQSEVSAMPSQHSTHATTEPPPASSASAGAFTTKNTRGLRGSQSSPAVVVIEPLAFEKSYRKIPRSGAHSPPSHQNSSTAVPAQRSVLIYPPTKAAKKRSSSSVFNPDAASTDRKPSRLLLRPGSPPKTASPPSSVASTSHKSAGGSTSTSVHALQPPPPPLVLVLDSVAAPSRDSDAESGDAPPSALAPSVEYESTTSTLTPSHASVHPSGDTSHHPLTATRSSGCIVSYSGSRPFTRGSCSPSPPSQLRRQSTKAGFNPKTESKRASHPPQQQETDKWICSPHAIQATLPDTDAKLWKPFMVLDDEEEEVDECAGGSWRNLPAPGSTPPLLYVHDGTSPLGDHNHLHNRSGGVRSADGLPPVHVVPCLVSSATGSLRLTYNGSNEFAPAGYVATTSATGTSQVMVLPGGAHRVSSVHNTSGVDSASGKRKISSGAGASSSAGGVTSTTGDGGASCSRASHSVGTKGGASGVGIACFEGCSEEERQGGPGGSPTFMTSNQVVRRKEGGCFPLLNNFSLLRLMATILQIIIVLFAIAIITIAQTTLRPFESWMWWLSDEVSYSETRIVTVHILLIISGVLFFLTNWCCYWWIQRKRKRLVEAALRPKPRNRAASQYTVGIGCRTLSTKEGGNSNVFSDDGSPPRRVYSGSVHAGSQANSPNDPYPERVRSQRTQPPPNGSFSRERLSLQAEEERHRSPPVSKRHSTPAPLRSVVSSSNVAPPVGGASEPHPAPTSATVGGGATPSAVLPASQPTRRSSLHNSAAKSNNHTHYDSGYYSDVPSVHFPPDVGEEEAASAAVVRAEAEDPTFRHASRAPRPYRDEDKPPEMPASPKNGGRNGRRHTNNSTNDSTELQRRQHSYPSFQHSASELSPVAHDVMASQDGDGHFNGPRRTDSFDDKSGFHCFFHALTSLCCTTPDEEEVYDPYYDTMPSRHPSVTFTTRTDGSARISVSSSSSSTASSGSCSSCAASRAAGREKSERNLSPAAAQLTMAATSTAREVLRDEALQPHRSVKPRRHHHHHRCTSQRQRRHRHRGPPVQDERRESMIIDQRRRILRTPRRPTLLSQVCQMINIPSMICLARILSLLFVVVLLLISVTSCVDGLIRFLMVSPVSYVWESNIRIEDSYMCKHIQLAQKCSGFEDLCNATGFDNDETAHAELCPFCTEEDQAVIATFTDSCKSLFNKKRVVVMVEFGVLLTVMMVLTVLGVLIFTGALLSGAWVESEKRW